MAWHFNRNGMYLVRLAYHCHWESKFGLRCNSVQAGRNQKPSMEKPMEAASSGEIKIFVWQALHRFIPCRAIHANRHIIDTGGCPMCQNGAEDIKHMLFTCYRAKGAWKSLGGWEMISPVLGRDRSDTIILEEMIRRGVRVRSLDVGLAELASPHWGLVYLVGVAI